MSNIRSDLSAPYFASVGNGDDALPGLDFCRDIVQPGTNETFPDGAIGIRVDADFWSVAALPMKYLDVPLKDLVAELWPHYAGEASFHPDSGSTEQAIEFSQDWARSRRHVERHYMDQIAEMQFEIDRLRGEKPPLKFFPIGKRRASANYFVRQYEYLLIAVAHENKPRDDMRGVCRECGLLGTDRVHMARYINLRKAGVQPHFKIAMEFVDEGKFNP